MNIQGLQKLTLLDYPGKCACTVFLAGCNLRCPFCHNSDLVVGGAEAVIDDKGLLSFLKKRRGLLDGVCITGGEPLLRKDLDEVVAGIKELGFLVKLDTNGAFPGRLKSLVGKGLIDYVAMDIKNCPARYSETAGLAPETQPEQSQGLAPAMKPEQKQGPGSVTLSEQSQGSGLLQTSERIQHSKTPGVSSICFENGACFERCEADSLLKAKSEFVTENSEYLIPTVREGAKQLLSNITESIDLLLSGAVEYEFRTTVVKEFHDAQAFEEIGPWVEGASKYFLQHFEDRGSVIEGGLHACSKEEMEAFAEILRPHVGEVSLRGI